jgi:glycerophosphoryl diester phosphodiesterase
MRIIDKKMKFIAHRGNTNGINPERENSMSYVTEALENGFDVEIDLWNISNNQWCMGHDSPDYPVEFWWLGLYSKNLWIHCKTLTALYKLSILDINEFNFFYHNTDYYTLTSKKYIWTYPGRMITANSILLFPETHYPNIYIEEMIRDNSIAGICSDNIEKYRNMVT